MRRIAIALFIVLCAGCAEEVTTEVELSGLVLDRATDAPVEGATVTFRSDTLDVATATTDSDGHYEMIVETQVSLGQVRAEHPDFEPAEKSVYFDTPQRRIDLLLRSITPGG
jgi:hypothetical protein